MGESSFSQDRNSRVETVTAPFQAEQNELVPFDIQEQPMVVVPKRGQISTNGTGGTARQLQHRGQKSNRNWVWLMAASVIVGSLIVWNHFVYVRLPNDGSTTVPKYQQIYSSQETTLIAVGEKKGQDTLSVDIGKEFDEKLPTSVKPALPYFHAAQALQCRESVVNFVINATDARDECEGLRKAFDKTCGSEEEIVSVDPSSSSSQNTPNVNQQSGKNKQSAAGDKKKHRFGERRAKERKRKRKGNKDKPRRRLSEKMTSLPDWNRWKVWLFETKRTLLEFWRRSFMPKKDFLFAEDEILYVWGDAETLVTNGMENLVHQDLVRQWEHERRRRRLPGSSPDDNDDGELYNHLPDDAVDVTLYNYSTPTTHNKTKTISNLPLPTTKKHATGGLIQDVLLLMQGDKFINQTSVAAKEAAESSKAISDSVAAVSALLNDPSSVAARTCCTSILNVYHENCSTDDEEEYSDTRLFFIVVVMALCGMVKSLIRHYQILWLPEAAGCIIVGIFSGYALMFFPHHDLSFDGHWFLRIMVPPIIFEAALSIDKRSFNRHLVPILLYAVAGTLLATFVTAEVVHRGSELLKGWCSPIPYIEALTFGALISSIDPIAVLSVLSNMGMTDRDTIYVVIFGESLLNDGVAIVLFETLVHFLDEHLIIDEQAIVEATIHFTVVALGSVLVGATAGLTATLYFWLFQGCQTPLVEVLMFFCWALLPYYVCDGIGWSGIVSAVATGFVMDIYIVGQRKDHMESDLGSAAAKTPPPRSNSLGVMARENIVFTISSVFSCREGHLSATARMHIGFVTGMIATTMETAIFAYLGLFLFSHRYHWNPFHASLAIFGCCFSRGVMIPFLSFFVNISDKVHRSAESLCGSQNTSNTQSSVTIDYKMQFVLWFAGLRGAMSFALVESIPLYDSVSGEGTPLKPELKAMTSASIMFTVFVLGGYTYYVMDGMGMAPPRNDKTEGIPEMKSLVLEEEEGQANTGAPTSSNGAETISQKSRRRQRPSS